jgi:hypothetical protein
MTTPPDDRALEYAKKCLRRYKHSMLWTHFLHQATDIGALVASIATFLVAASHASNWVTAGLAALTTFLAGIRRLFEPGETWVRVTAAHNEIERAIIFYEDAQDPTPERRQALLSKVSDVRDAEQQQWATQQRRLTSVKLPEPPTEKSPS